MKFHLIKYRKYFLLVGLLAFFLVSNAQLKPGQALLKQFSADSALRHAPVSIYAVNLNTGEVLAETVPQLCVTPASVLKLVTSATALEVFGSDYRFETTVWTDGPVVGRTLRGNLIISGGGDPTLGSAYFKAENQKRDFLKHWVELVKQKGIDSINGNIIVDPTFYADQDVPQTWIWEDLGNYFGAAARGIAIYDNTFRINFETENTDGGATRVSGTVPFIPNLEIRNEVLASNEQRDRAYVFGSTFDSFRVIKGTLPRGRSNFSIKASIPDPALLLGYELSKMLSDLNVVVSGTYISQKHRSFNYGSFDLLISKWYSPPLAEIIKQLNFESINLYAEHLCKHLGKKMNGEGSTLSGVEFISSFWQKRGVDVENLFLADGSGLSRTNAITAKTLVEVLTYMYSQSDYYDVFLESIPVTGENGTQQYYFQNSFLKGKVHAKSGSMNRVRSFAGYMTTANDTPVAYAVIVNNYKGGSFDMVHKLEKLMEQFYEQF